MTTTPTDRDALNRQLRRLEWERTVWPLATVDVEYHEDILSSGPDYCGSLDAANDALNALGLRWQLIWNFKDGYQVMVHRLQDPRVHAAWPVIGVESAALATALVQAALQVLGRDEGNTDED